eukprot:EC849811.1.p1 GENE.EC849811.1~~EC849811.1.p1  ORF type:complete len:110 (+),score=43.11 EC849811.1:37-330(+)
MSLSSEFAAQQSLISSLQAVPGQTGVAVVTYDGVVVEKTGEVGDSEAKQIYLLLQDSYSLLHTIGDTALQRVTISQGNTVFTVSTGNERLYIVKKHL